MKTLRMQDASTGFTMISPSVSVDSIPDVLLNFSLGVHIDTTGNLSLSTKIWKEGRKLCLRLDYCG